MLSLPYTKKEKYQGLLMYSKKCQSAQVGTTKVTFEFGDGGLSASCTSFERLNP